MYKEVGKTKRKPFLAGFSLRNKQSSRGSAGIHNRFSFRQHFRTQQQQRWQKNTRQTAKKSNGKTPKTNRNYLLQRFSRTSSTKNIRTGSSFSQGNVPGRIKTKCSSRRKDFLFCPILGKAHKRSGNFRNSEGYKIPLLKTLVQGNIPLNIPLKKKVSQNKDQHAQNQFLSNLSNPLLVRN